MLNRCEYAIHSKTIAEFDGDTDSLGNSYKNITIAPPSNGYSEGIHLTGTANSDTAYNLFENVMVGGSTSHQISFYLAAIDSNTFMDVHLADSAARPVVFDYSINAAWPAANMFYGIDPGSNSAAIEISAGSPSGSSANHFYGTMGSNGGSCPSVTNLTCN